MGGTSKAFEVIIGFILVIYLLGSVWTGIQNAIANATGTGSALLILLPLILVICVVYVMYKMSFGKA